MQRIEDLLPQTQCTKCTYPDCHAYAQAVADGQAGYNQCPPGGAEGVRRIANLLGKPEIPLNPDNGVERALLVARINESACIGCTLCIQACPTDAIVGAGKQMHTVLPDWCTGCDLCVAPCPVDCIVMVPVTEETGWAAWSDEQAQNARTRYAFRKIRLLREKAENDIRLALRAAEKLNAIEAEPATVNSELESKDRKRAIILAAIDRARVKARGGVS